MRFSHVGTLTAALALSALPSLADRAAAQEAPGAAAQQPAVAPSHLAAVKRLMEVTRIRELTEQSVETTLAGQPQQMPQLAPYADVLREFYRENLSWAVLEPEFTRLYVEVFTEADLREMITFYESPLGQKMLTRLPALLVKSNEITMRRLQASMPQLMQRLQAAMQARPPGAKPDSAAQGQRAPQSMERT
jgi:uncharacterized protein